MDADGTGADGFEFNLTRVLESLDRRESSLGTAPPPLTITPVSDEPEPPAPLPTRVPSQRGGQGAPGQRTRPAPRPARTTEPTAPAEPLPVRTASTHKPALVPPGRRSMFDEAASGEARAALHRVPADTNVAVAALETPLLPTPTLPPASAAPPPGAASAQVAAPMPTAADIRQFQNAQRRRARKNNQGRVMGRMMLVLVLFTAAVALALTVGRDYLFPADWPDALAPLVDDIEAARGTQFDEVVPLEEQPASSYATTLGSAVLGPDAATRLAVWRALGVATGEFDPAAIGAELAATQPAVFDAESGSIVHLAGADADLRPALEAALDHQLGRSASGPIGVLGPVPATGRPALATAPTVPTAPTELSLGGPLTPPVGAIAAAEQVVGELADDATPSLDQIELEQVEQVEQPEPLEPAEQLDTVPAAQRALPIAYQLAAAERLAPLLSSSRDLPGATVALAPEAVLAPGDSPLAAPVSLGLDDWALVWANRLPADSVDTLLAATTANSVRTFERAGTVCVGAVFQAGNEMFAAALVNDLARWAAAGPAEAQAAATQVAPTYVQLVSCDPGAVPQPLDQRAVGSVLDRQIARLNTTGEN